MKIKPLSFIKDNKIWPALFFFYPDSIQVLPVALQPPLKVLVTVPLTTSRHPSWLIFYDIQTLGIFATPALKILWHQLHLSTHHEYSGFDCTPNTFFFKRLPPHHRIQMSSARMHSTIVRLLLCRHHPAPSLPRKIFGGNPRFSECLFKRSLFSS